MITRTQSKMLRGDLAFFKEPRLSHMEKAMLKWIVVDPDDRLLDTCIGSGMMAEYLRRNMQCEICGVSDNMEHVRYARSRLSSSDIVYAPKGDIPWREDAFDTVLMKLAGEDDEQLARMFKEGARVLKPGGQLIVGLKCYPAVLADAWKTEEGDRRALCKERVAELLRRSSFHHMTWQRTGLTGGVLIAWKPKPSVEQVRKAV